MLSMGFLEDIERVVSHLPEKKQTLLFSATMPDEVQRYARRHMKTAETLSLSRDQISVSDIHHAYYIVSGIARSRDLLKIIYAEEPESAIIFCQHEGRDDDGRQVPPEAGPRRRAALVGPLAGRSRARDGSHEGEEPSLPVCDRCRRARHRHLEPLARDQLLGAGAARDLRAPHRPHRSRRQEGHRPLDGRPARARQLPLRAPHVRHQAGRAPAGRRTRSSRASSRCRCRPSARRSRPTRSRS